MLLGPNGLVVMELSTSGGFWAGGSVDYGWVCSWLRVSTEMEIRGVLAWIPVLVVVRDGLCGKRGLTEEAVEVKGLER